MAEHNKFVSAKVKADIIWMLQPFIDYQRNLDFHPFPYGSIIIEPRDKGGAIIVGISMHAIAIFHDPDGLCTAPMTLDLPDALFEACKPDRLIDFHFSGEEYSSELPEWAQPGIVAFTNAGAFVAPKMRHPQWADEGDDFQPMLYECIASLNHHTIGLDYKYTDGSKINWRKTMDLASKSTKSAVHNLLMNPVITALYQRLHGHIAFRTIKGQSVYFTPNGKDAPITVQLDNYQDFIGYLMPMRECNPLNHPDWLTEKEQSS